ncbi:hypothetical protein CHELA40_13464 [Chelatococcus asaccharovorans]|nr:hypothetical protein CHELA40_13464 [Chelatococcus asaccharovorans]CAH1677843.1 hypothetical protein CHELA17_62156 [Chelatococcus asaccharovorans]
MGAAVGEQHARHERGHREKPEEAQQLRPAAPAARGTSPEKGLGSCLRQGAATLAKARRARGCSSAAQPRPLSPAHGRWAAQSASSRRKREASDRVAASEISGIEQYPHEIIKKFPKTEPVDAEKGGLKGCNATDLKNKLDRTTAAAKRQRNNRSCGLGRI